MAVPTSRAFVDRPGTAAFTLIEISIVLVIIGLIVGGVLVGQDLIRAAGVRAQISQIEKYNTAVNTFRGKYGYLPGDIKDPDASNFGFAARGPYAGEGDGNGVIEGNSNNVPGANSGVEYEAAGETLMFWADLAKAGLIEGGFTAAMPSMPGTQVFPLSTGFDSYFPAAKIENSNYIYI
jgi:prepilin-type N-terminal cleavage/methylation domain-containing protein